MPTSPIIDVMQRLRRALLRPEGANLTDGQLLGYFLTRHEHAALEALVCRHGPMVWGVCRRILRNPHDAEDARRRRANVLGFPQMCDRLCPRLDQGLAALLEDLHQRGLADDVVIVVWGEFGRSPRINKDAGRDHWLPAMSAVLAGGGLRMGQVIGSTDARGEYPRKIGRTGSPTC